MAKTTKKNTVRVEVAGQAHIQATFNNIIISLPCRHNYHKKCISKWLTEGKASCPICNATL